MLDKIDTRDRKAIQLVSHPLGWTTETSRFGTGWRKHKQIIDKPPNCYTNTRQLNQENQSSSCLTKSIIRSFSPLAPASPPASRSGFSSTKTTASSSVYGCPASLLFGSASGSPSWR